MKKKPEAGWLLNLSEPLLMRRFTYPREPDDPLWLLGVATRGMQRGVLGMLDGQYVLVNGGHITEINQSEIVWALRRLKWLPPATKAPPAAPAISPLPVVPLVPSVAPTQGMPPIQPTAPPLPDFPDLGIVPSRWRQPATLPSIMIKKIRRPLLPPNKA